MADFTYSGGPVRGGPDADGPRPDLRRIVGLTGTALSAGLMAGLVWWGWALMQRDVHGVPVVRALEGAMREAPADPGGSAASHQGLAVSRVQAEGMAAPPPAELFLAPTPMDLADEDRPQAALLADEAAARSADPLAGMPLPGADGSAVAGPQAETPAPGAVADAVAAVPDATAPDATVTAAPLLPAASQPLAQAVPVPEVSIASSAIEAALAEALGLSPADMPASRSAAGVVPVSVPGVARSPRPAPRPEGDGIETAPVVLANAVVPAEPTPWRSQPAPGVPSLNDATIAVAPAAGVGAPRVVQLGAFDTPEQAAAEWQRLASAYADLIGDRAYSVERAVTNGRTFYRLRAGGFDDLADARRFCVALVTNGAACIPVPQ
ncbi:MAG: SPOR domain-containing protein [Rhodobacteraceae bacterium]|jgi:hypothetical protein|nr:SPOR domain-containing protein [Paracoccaceae bacterium]